MKKLQVAQMEVTEAGSICSFGSGFFNGMALGSLLYGNAPGAAVFATAGIIVSAYCDGIRKPS